VTENTLWRQHLAPGRASTAWPDRSRCGSDLDRSANVYDSQKPVRVTSKDRTTALGGKETRDEQTKQDDSRGY
jgi:hypothetical protein